MTENNEKDDISQLVERDMTRAGLVRVCIVFIGLAIAHSVHSVYSIVKYLADDSIPSTVCPKTYSLDAPVLMKTITREKAEIKDRWMRGFVRRFVTAQFPRTPEDVAPAFTYAANHSTGDIRSKYKSLLKSLEDVQIMIKSGRFRLFYPKKSDNDAFRIRATDSPNQWKVEVDGYLVKRMGGTTERLVPTLHYTIEAGKATLDNPEGLYVIEADMDQILDPVAGTRETL